jgi:hypothetical protein
MKSKLRLFIIYLFLANLILFTPSWLLTESRAQTVDSSDCPLPPGDILGEDIPGFPRYPAAVRIQYNKDVEKSIRSLNQRANGMEVVYRSNDIINNILDFYKHQTQEQKWELLSSRYITNNSIHIIFGKGEKRILLILRPYNPVFISPARSTDAAGDHQPPASPINCHVIQVFSWNTTQARAIDRRSNLTNRRR